MLRIRIHNDDSVCRLELAGRLEGPWVTETEHAWLSSLCSAKQIEIDMRQLTGVDESGRELLSAMHRAGSRLVVEGVWMAALVEEITVKQPSNGTVRRPATTKTRRKQRLPDQERSK